MVERLALFEKFDAFVYAHVWFLWVASATQFVACHHTLSLSASVDCGFVFAVRVIKRVFPFRFVGKHRE